MAYGAHVQSRVTNGSGTSLPLAYVSDVTGANTLIVGTRYGDTPGTVNVSDTRGNTWVPVFAFPFAGDLIVMQLWYALSNASSGANTVTTTTTNSVGIHLAILEYEGASLFDDSAWSFGYGSSALTSGDMTISVANALVLGVAGTLATESFTPGTDFVERLEQNVIAVADRVVPSAGTYASTMATTTVADWTMTGVAFRAATGAGHAAMRRLGGMQYGPRRGMQGVF